MGQALAAPLMGQPGPASTGSFWEDEAKRARYEQFKRDSRDAEIALDAKDLLASWRRRAALLIERADADRESALLDEVMDDSQTSHEEYGFRLTLAVLAGDANEIARIAAQIRQHAESKADRMAEGRYEARRE